MPQPGPVRVGLHDIVSLVRFHYQESPGILEKLAPEETFAGVRTSLEDLQLRQSPTGQPTSSFPSQEYLQQLKAPWDSGKAWYNCPHNPWTSWAHQTLDPAAVTVASQFTGSLIFNTTVARLGAVHINNSRRSLGAGWDGPPKKVDEPVEAVVICGYLSPGDYIGRSWFLIFMMIERSPEDNHACRRLGIGRIELSEWTKCNPRWETIVLR